MDVICSTFTRDNDLCCHCGKELPESVADWHLTDPVHVFCSASCAEEAR